MVKKYTKNTVEGGLVLDGLNAAGNAVGMKLSKPKIKKELETGFSVVNQLIEMLLTKHGNNNKREVELTSLGLMALYNFYRGFNKQKKLAIIKGVFLSATLVAAVVAYIKLNNNSFKAKGYWDYNKIRMLNS